MSTEQTLIIVKIDDYTLIHRRGTISVRRGGRWAETTLAFSTTVELAEQIVAASSALAGQEIDAAAERTKARMKKHIGVKEMR